jgi:hypothetical protein
MTDNIRVNAVCTGTEFVVDGGALAGHTIAGIES